MNMEKKKDPFKPDEHKNVFRPMGKPKKADRVPILRGCRNSTCFCTGKCQEVIGWRDKLPDEA